MPKRKELNIADTKMALMGSDLDKKLRLQKANAQVAFQGVGQAPGLEVWRIEKFEPVPWKKLGKFYDGDSYIVLHTQEEDDVLKWDIYFWLGQYTSLDEAGTAAFTTVELDDALGQAPVQHREVQMHETEEFLLLWSDMGGLRIMNGGVESGFNDVDTGEAGEWVPRDPELHLVSGPTMRTARISKLPEVDIALLSEEDCYVLDSGRESIFLYRGEGASPGETAKAGRFANELANERPDGDVRFCSSSDAPDEFWELLGGKCAIPKSAPNFVRNRDNAPAGSEQKEPYLVHVTDVSGSVQATTVATGTAMKGYTLNDSDCYILIEPKRATAWLGSGASLSEKRTAPGRMGQIMVKEGNSLATTSVVKQGREPDYFAQLVL